MYVGIWSCFYLFNLLNVLARFFSYYLWIVHRCYARDGGFLELTNSSTIDPGYKEELFSNRNYSDFAHELKSAHRLNSWHLKSKFKVSALRALARFKEITMIICICITGRSFAGKIQLGLLNIICVISLKAPTYFITYY